MILFFQSGIEALVTNWTTTYLISAEGVEESQALLALSVFVATLTVTRIFLAVILRTARSYQVLSFSYVMALTGIVIIAASNDYPLALLGISLLGVGLAAGFPVILGYVGDIYTEISGTAYSLVFVIAIAGNILCNFTMGAISHRFGMDTYSPFVVICIVMVMFMVYITLRRISDKTRI